MVICIYIYSKMSFCELTLNSIGCESRHSLDQGATPS